MIKNEIIIVFMEQSNHLCDKEFYFGFVAIVLLAVVSIKIDLRLDEMDHENCVVIFLLLI